MTRYNRTVDLLCEGRASTDNFRLVAGLRVAQMGKHYGARLVENLASTPTSAGLRYMSMCG